MSLTKRRQSIPAAKNSRRYRRTFKDEESECFSDEVDLEVARRLHSLHFSSLALYEVYFGFSDDQIRVGSPSVVSSCSEVPGSPTRFPSSSCRRKRNVVKPFRRGRKKKKMEQQNTDWMEVVDTSNGRSEMPEKGGNPLLKGHRYNPLTRGKQKLGHSSGKKKPIHQGTKQANLAAVGTVVDSEVARGSERYSGKQLRFNLSTGSATRMNQSCEATEDMEEESRDSFTSSVAMVGCNSDSESDLSDTTDEQGEEADDEESSFETVLAPQSASHWFERDCERTSDEDTDVFSTDSCFGSLLSGLQPIMSEDSWKKFTNSLKNDQMGNKRQNYKSFTGKRYSRRPQSRRPAQAKSVCLSPEEINQEIIHLVDSQQLDSFPLPLMSRRNCQVVCDLAKVYGIRCAVVGGSNMAAAAAITLHKTPDTHMADQDMVREKIKSFRKSSPPCTSTPV